MPLKGERFVDLMLTMRPQAVDEQFLRPVEHYLRQLFRRENHPALSKDFVDSAQPDDDAVHRDAGRLELFDDAFRRVDVLGNAVGDDEHDLAFGFFPD